MKHLIIMTAFTAPLGVSSTSMATGEHSNSDEREEMRVQKPNVEHNALSSSHADKKK